MILDFGAARDKIRQRLFEHSELIVPYTPHYSPIEQDPEARLDLGPWTDIYQVGALIYRCVSGGKIPASSERIRGDAYFPLIEFFGSSPDYPRAFLEAIDWSLSLLPEDRPRSISAWKARLSQPMEEMLRREAEPQTRITKLESPRADDDPPRRDGANGLAIGPAEAEKFVRRENPGDQSRCGRCFCSSFCWPLWSCWVT